MHHLRPLARSAAPALLLLATLLAAPAPVSAQLDFHTAARTYLEDREVPAAEPGQVDLPALLREQYAGARLGAIDLRFPRSVLEDRKRFDQVQDLAIELLEAQELWSTWLAPGELEEAWKEAEVDEHVDRLSRWVKGWRASRMEDAFDEGVRDFAPDPEDDERERKSYDVLAEYLSRGRPLEVEVADGEPTTVTLIPGRKEFVELACLFGWVNSWIRHEYWQENTWAWTQFYFEDSHFVAMEFAATPRGGPEFSGDYTPGTPMKEFNPEGLEQQVVQLSMRAVVKKLFGGRLTPALESGLASLLVVEKFGEVDTRTDGDLRAKRTEARSMFVPGGASAGGTLPPDYADGRFRSPNHGSDYFVPSLRYAQRAGADDVRSRSEQHLRFEVLADDEVDTWLLEAPLLDPSAARLTPPSREFRGDLLELMRAYRICFVHWLRNESTDDEDDSQRRFARMLQALGSGDATLGDAVKAAYDAALSDPSVSRDCLEGRFLRWLAKQR